MSTRPLALVVALCLLLAPRLAHAGFHSTELAGWGAWQWTPEDGLPSAEIAAIAFDPEGLAWIATLDGLVRFDGDEFVIHDPGSDPGLGSARFTDVLITDDGVVWALMEGGGLARREEGGFEPVPLEPLGIGAPVRLTTTSAGAWVVGRKGLARIRGGELVAIPFPGRHPHPGHVRLLVEEEGAHYAVTFDGSVHRFDPVSGALVLLEGGAGSRLVSTPPRWPGGPAPVLVRDGRAYVSTEGGLQRPAGATPRIDPALPASALLLPGQDGSVLATGPNGLLRLHGGRLEPAPPESAPAPGAWWAHGGVVYRGARRVLELASDADILAVDASGAAWVAAVGGGLYHLRPTQARSITEDVLGPIGPVNSVLVTADGALWIGAWGGLRRRLYGTQPVVDQAGAVLRETLGLAELDDGRVLVATTSTTCLVDEVPAAGPVPCAPPEQPLGLDHQVILEDRRGTLWLGSGNLLRARAGEAPQDVVRLGGWNPVRAIVEAPDGAVVASQLGVGLHRVVGDDLTLRPGEAGSPLRAVRALLFDDVGDLWLGTEGQGVCRLRLSAGPFDAAPLHCAGERQGLADGFVSSLLGTPDGLLWTSSNTGVHVLVWDDLRAVLDGERERLDTLSLGRSAGLVEPETNGVRKPSVAQGPDGTLWYPTMRGVAGVHPEDVDLGEPPPAVLDALSSPTRPLSLGVPARLEPDERELRARWTAPAFAHRDRLRFRYRLAGLDVDWRGPTQERTATWTNLPPGAYTLELQTGWAGRWRAPRAVATVSVPARIWETDAFRGFLFLLALGAVALGGRLRASRLRARQVELEAAVDAATARLAERNTQIQAQAAALADRNERIRAQTERLEQLDVVRSQFVANISHELRTPVTLVRGLLMDAASTAPESLRSPLTVAWRNAEQLADLVEQLLDVARLDVGGVPLRARHTAVQPWLARVIERFEGAGHGVELRLQVDDCPDLWFDPDLLEKAVGNLIANGIDFSGDGGWLAVRAWATGDAESGHVRIEVVDSGPGVAPEALDRLFDRFYQVDASDRRERGGTGIGLALAREFVQLHGGRIGVENTGDAGACFWIELPLGVAHLAPSDLDLQSRPKLPPVAPPSTGSPSAPAARGEGPIALVVEDHPDMRAYIAQHLSAAFDVVTAVDGRDALEQLRAGLRPAVVVSDVMMPRMDGLSLVRTLRADPALSDQAVLLLSAKATDTDRHDGLELADDYVTKPFRAPELVLRARNLARRGVAEPPAPPDSFLYRLEELARPELADEGFRANELAKKAALSPRQLLRRVREDAGLTTAAWLRQLRLRAAQELLQSGRIETVGEAAAAVGFSRAYLSRAYTEWAGHSPSDDLPQS